MGLIVVGSGVAMMFFAAAIFQARETTKNPYGEPTKFVVQPPYTWTRNPMYLSFVMVLLDLRSSSNRSRCCWRRPFSMR